MSEIHFDDTYLNQFGHFGALLDSFGVKMFQNGQKWHLEGSKSPEWLEQVEQVLEQDGHHQE